MIDTSVVGLSTFYEIYDISQYEKDIPEQLGTKSKFWYTDEKGNLFLFKSISSKNGERIGEDWAEKIASELAEMIGLPHAYYELATYKGKRGVITPIFFAPSNGEFLTTGNELLQTLDDFGYDNQNIQYVDDIYHVMTHMINGVPINSDGLCVLKTASEFFVGYLMFDVLISNQDRHNENWGRIMTKIGSFLAPSYDHGASLARNESDETRHLRLYSKDKGQQIVTYVQKARAQFHSPNTKKRLKLLEAFHQYGLKEKLAARIWLDRLYALKDEQIKMVIDKVPSTLMSDISKQFTYQLVVCNKANLLSLSNEFL